MTIDFVQQVDLLKQNMRSFFMGPTHWRQSRVTIPLTWTGVRFIEASKSQIPDARGIYCFIVRHENGHFPPHGYIMYIGITGARSTTRTLRMRFADYMREKTRDKRPKITYMLRKYEDDLFFYFVPLDDPSIALEQLETDLNDCILPPSVTNDFSAEIRSQVRAMP